MPFNSCLTVLITCSRFFGSRESRVQERETKGQVRRYSKEMALLLEWFERVGYSADIAGLEREFGRALTKLPDWAHRHARPNGR